MLLVSLLSASPGAQCPVAPGKWVHWSERQIIPTHLAWKCSLNRAEYLVPLANSHMLCRRFLKSFLVRNSLSGREFPTIWLWSQSKAVFISVAETAPWGRWKEPGGGSSFPVVAGGYIFCSLVKKELGGGVHAEFLFVLKTVVT